MSARIGPRLGPAHVGQRVVIRRRLPAGRFADVLGDLLSWDRDGDATARVLTRHGEVAVPIAEVVTGKAVPPAPVRRGQPHRAIGWEGLEDVAADGWRPLELEWLGPRGQGWRLRAAAGFTGRANSVLPLGDPALPLEQAVEQAEQWYGSRRLPARFSVPWPHDAPRLEPDASRAQARDTELDAVLRRRGYLLDTPTLVLTAALRDVARAVHAPGSPGVPDGLRLTVDDEPDDAWLAVYRYRGQDLPEVARRLLLSAPAQAFVSLRDAEGTVAVGRASSSRGWTGVTAMEVSTAYRRRGLARLVLGSVAQWGLERGDRSAFLQVAEKNTAARRLYAAVGFTEHHGYHYRVLPLS